MRLFLKICAAFLIYVIQAQATFALSYLPKNAYLVQGDNLKEVKILQQILNSNTDTQIAETGPGSPGNENWLFGRLTFVALKKFQEIYELEVTGRVDYKTWAKINEYVDDMNGMRVGITSANSKYATNNSDNSKISSIQEKVKFANDERVRMNEQNKKDLAEVKKIKSEKAKEQEELIKEEKKTFLESVVDKYTNFFYAKKGDVNSNATTSTSDATQIYSNSPSAQTPYYDPNTGIYSSRPVTNQTQQPANNLMGAQSSANPFLPQGGNPYMNYGGQPTQQYFPQSPPQDPRTLLDQSTQWGPCEPMKEGNSAVLAGGGQGGGCGKGSNFGNNPNGTDDSGDNGDGCTTASGARYNTRIRPRAGMLDGKEGVALPLWIQTAMFGSPRAACGGWIEVTDPQTKKCIKFRIVDTGPNPNTGRIIDFTGVAENRMGVATTDRKFCFRKAVNQNQSQK